MTRAELIYFDHNATTNLLPGVAEAMAEVMTSPLNSSSVHSFGRLGKKHLAAARTAISNLVAADDSYQVIFTSGGTESNNIALRGFTNGIVLTAPTEHVAVLNCVKSALLKVNENGQIDLNNLESLLSAIKHEGPVIVSVMTANNETGVIQNLSEIVSIAKHYGALVHSDACQYIGRLPFSLQDTALDLLTFSAHKMGGPQGVGALIFKKDLPLSAINFGGGQESRIRPGTHNLAGIVGFGKAAEQSKNFHSAFAQLSEIRDYIENAISKEVPKAKIIGIESPRLANTSNIIMPGVPGDVQVIFFDGKGIAVSAGSACSSGRTDLPHVQMAMGLNEETARCALRISLGINNTMQEAIRFVDAWLELYNNVNKKV